MRLIASSRRKRACGVRRGLVLRWSGLTRCLSMRMLLHMGRQCRCYRRRRGRVRHAMPSLGNELHLPRRRHSWRHRSAHWWPISILWVHAGLKSWWRRPLGGMPSRWWRILPGGPVRWRLVGMSLRRRLSRVLLHKLLRRLLACRGLRALEPLCPLLVLVLVRRTVPALGGGRTGLSCLRHHPLRLLREVLPGDAIALRRHGSGTHWHLSLRRHHALVMP